ncbi:MAG: hypothetical protein D6706_19960 [Chloroflexi bacterium]|nr:MAG: hypothetical protein D6706_19960 [Chloroflexota bacterium]
MPGRRGDAWILKRKGDGQAAWRRTVLRGRRRACCGWRGGPGPAASWGVGPYCFICFWQAKQHDCIVVDAVRFLKQFTTGFGDYTQEREKIFVEKTLAEVIREIKQQSEK